MYFGLKSKLPLFILTKKSCFIFSLNFTQYYFVMSYEPSTHFMINYNSIMLPTKNNEQLELKNQYYSKTETKNDKIQNIK